MMKTCQCGQWHTADERPTRQQRDGGAYHTHRECFGLDPASGATCLWSGDAPAADLAAWKRRKGMIEVNGVPVRVAS